MRIPALFAAIAFGALGAVSSVADGGPQPAAAASGSAHDYSFTSIDGDPMPLAAYSGKPVLVVNTASFCGFTDQYRGLQAVWERYRDDGLVVIGVPSNDFGNQEPGTEAEIKEFCEINYDITFPLTRKTVVKGAEAHPFYAWARQTLGPRNAPRWNFHKYLVGTDGRLIDAFGTATGPATRKVTAAIEAALRE